MSIWPEALAEVLFRRSVTLVVDGFDEMGESCQKDFMRCLAECKKIISQEETAKLRLLLLPRDDQEAETRLRGGEEFRVYQMTREDIRGDMLKTVAAKMGIHEQEETSDSLPREFCKAIVQSSAGSYTRATVAAEELTHVRAVSDLGEAQAALEELPRDAKGLYKRSLRKMHEAGDDLSLVKHVLRWAVF